MPTPLTSPMHRRTFLTGSLASGALATAVPSAGATPRRPAPELRTWAEQTWRCLDALTVPATGLAADDIGADLSTASRGHQTSPTNIGCGLWSTVAARELGLLDRGEAKRRLARTLESIAGLERHEQSGMYYNWYDPADGRKLTEFPTSGEVVKSFLSSVDNGWLAAALLVVERAEPSLRRQARDLRCRMDFGFSWDAAENAPGGQLRGGFWDVDPDEDAAVVGNYRGGDPVWYTGHHYGAFNTEPRIASYLGIAAGQIPPEHYWGPVRTFPDDSCDYSWTETEPQGSWRTYGGVRMFEGALPYRGKLVVPTWGGSMFEALMVPLLVPEDEWGARSWRRNHPLYVQCHIEHGMQEAGYGYWGSSPSNDPAGGYREYGVDQLGLDGPGYTSDEERTTVDQAFEGCRPGSPAPTSYGDGVVTPHASFLALRYAPDQAVQNLRNLAADFDCTTDGGFLDAIAVRSGRVSDRFLALDQGMVMASLGNALGGDVLRRHVGAEFSRTLRPLMQQEVFATRG
ncbi:glucoamylase family protein [Kineococcus sp. DHX-1]|uniref:glucoamylase family protein n=1 Tax=Kineococcus sp. DHX-1 TaxID=3349638 RepID=UPI0036D40BDA